MQNLTDLGYETLSNQQYSHDLSYTDNRLFKLLDIFYAITPVLKKKGKLPF